MSASTLNAPSCRRYLSEGRAEGAAKGKAQLVLKQLSVKFGDVSTETRQRVESASMNELDLWAERLLSAQRLEDVLH